MLQVSGQTDSIPPAPPLFERVSVNYQTGFTELKWSPGMSPDVAGYVIYSFRNNEGYAIDTVHDPYATNYIYRQAASSFFSETFVVAAIDSSVNTSPLSNALRTIFASAVTDSCRQIIRISWNSYISTPFDVTGYSIFKSSGGGSYTRAGDVSDTTLSFTISDFTDDTGYCFFVNARLEDGSVSGSNKSCLTTSIQKPPQWINADYATIDENRHIMLSFSFDLVSEISTFILEKKSVPGKGFQEVARLVSENGSLKFTDENADISIINFYRLSAVNRCNSAVISSNLSSNIALSLNQSAKEISLKWNPYREWNGNVGSYRIFMDTGTGFAEKATVSPPDTSLIIDYREIMGYTTDEDICFFVEAVESGNPYGINGISRSDVMCTTISERVMVPDLFTPNNDLVNDVFRPVITFTPVSYHLVISGMNGTVLFESDDYLSEWDGSYNGKPLPPGVYLWFIRIKTPSGKNITRTGTVTIVNY
jgi:gliding motility-associated-like protein